MRRTARLVLLYVLEAVAALLALTIFLGVLALWRLASGPVPLEMVRPAVTEALVEAFDGARAEIGALSVSYDPAFAALVITASDVSVFETSGELVTRARRIEAGLALDLLLLGRAAPVRFAAEGGSFAVVRRLDGSLSAGLGRADRVATTPARSGGSVNDLLSSLLSGAEGTALSRLLLVDLRGADIRVVDEITDTSLFFQDARAHVDLGQSRVGADLSGALLTSAGQALFALDIESDRAFDSLIIDLRVRDLVPATVAPRRGMGAGAGMLDAPVDLDLVVDASREAGLRSALVDLRVGGGLLRLPSGARVLESARAHLGYDTQAGRIELHTLEVASDVLQLSLTGEISDLAGFDNALPSRAAYQLSSGAGQLDLTEIFPEPIVWLNVDAAGRIDLDTLSLSFDSLVAAVPGADATFAGGLRVEQVDDRWLPGIRLDGPINGEIGKADVLRFWPMEFALGARDWVVESILRGRLSNAYLRLDITPQALAARFLENDALSLSFEFADADVRYVSTMTPLLGLSGSAELLGNALTLDGTGGQIGDLEIDTIWVRLDQLNPKGAMARFGGSGRGAAADLIALIDEEPLGFATDYGIDPQSFEGNGSVRFEIHRPMLREVPVEDVGFEVTADFADVSGPAGLGDLRFEDGTVLIEATPARLTGTGEASLAGARAQIRWEETFGGGEEALSTQITVSTRADGRTLDQVGLPVRRFLDGTVGVEAQVRGRGLDFREVSVQLDLADTTIAVPGELWAKEPGEPAAVGLEMAFLEEGGVRLDRLTAAAADVAINATALLDAQGRLLAAETDRFFVENLVDVAVRAGRPAGDAGPLLIRMTGPSVNARDLLDRLRSLPPATPGSGVALQLEAAIEQVTVRDIAFQQFDLNLETTAQGLARLMLSGRTQAGAVEVSFREAGDGSGVRVLHAEGADAGAMLAAFAGFDNVRGGELQLTGTAPPLGESGMVEGSLQVTAFTLERMPLLARLLAAGSLEGLGSLLSGQGIEFERFSSDFSWENGALGMSDARVAGPALGVSWSGVVDVSGRRMGIDGTLLPSYGLNSVLGELPVLGELLTSRRGEGVIGITFSVQGPFDATRVTANPLSALAPGVFRRIFEGTSAERELVTLEAQRRAAQAEQDAAAAQAEAGTSADAPPQQPDQGPD